jgi:hypothetical protein
LRGFFFFTGGVASIADAICPTVKGCRLIALLRGFLEVTIAVLTYFSSGSNLFS